MSGAPLVKICGLRNAETARAISELELPVDYAGFVFAPSKRKVDARQAREIMDAFGPKPPRFAGVFVNPAWDELDHVMSIAPLSAIQLHGEEAPHTCKEVKERYPHAQVWKAMGMRQDAKHDEASVFERLQPYAGAIDVLLLDAWDPHVGGGTGQTFHWDLVPSYRKWAEQNGAQLFIAGGLHADNVRDMLSVCSASGVDVSSGVETDGQKDIDKIRLFTERVKAG